MRTITAKNMVILNRCIIFILVKRLLIIVLVLLAMNSGIYAQNKPAMQLADPVVKLVRFYPNPATTAITFDFQNGIDKSYTLQIYNFMGRKVYELPNFTHNTTVPLADFYRGLYVYQLRENTGEIAESGRFQVIK